MSLTVDQLALQLSITPGVILDFLDELKMPVPHLKSELDAQQQVAVRQKFERPAPARPSTADPRMSAAEEIFGPLRGPDPEEERLKAFLFSGQKATRPPRRPGPKPINGNPFAPRRGQPRRKPAVRPRVDAAETEKKLNLDLDWARRDFDLDERRAWERAGLASHQAAVAEQCRRLGLEPADLDVRLGRYKVGERLRNGESVGTVYARLKAEQSKAA